MKLLKYDLQYYLDQQFSKRLDAHKKAVQTVFEAHARQTLNISSEEIAAWKKLHEETTEIIDRINDARRTLRQTIQDENLQYTIDCGDIASWLLAFGSRDIYEKALRDLAHSNDGSMMKCKSLPFYRTTTNPFSQNYYYKPIDDERIHRLSEDQLAVHQQIVALDDAFQPVIDVMALATSIVTNNTSAKKAYDILIQKNIIDQHDFVKWFNEKQYNDSNKAPQSDANPPLKIKQALYASIGGDS